jgi:hypothetical protein
MDFGNKEIVALIAGGASGNGQATAKPLTINIFVNGVGIPGTTGDCLEISDDAWPEALGVER